MAVCGIDPEDHRVARRVILDVDNRVRRIDAPDLQDAALKRLAAEIHAHGNQTILADIAVPGIVMPAARRQAIHATLEAADPAAAGEFRDQLEKRWVIAGQLERARQRVGHGAQLDTNAVVDTLDELSTRDGVERLTEERAFEERSKLQIAALLEVRARRDECAR